MKRIRGLRRLEETTLRLGGVGDNWRGVSAFATDYSEGSDSPWTTQQ